MNRTLLCALVLLLAAGFSSGADRRPNVVLILADDLGYECITANGGESYKTPNIDKLAENGMRFENCHVQPLCTPTRAQLMTGISNVRNYTHFGHLDPGQTTFGNLMKDAGFATCITGKWQLGHDFGLPAHFGFDEYCLWQLTRRPERYKNPGLEINGKLMDYENGEYGPDVVNEYALDFITRKKDVPFFLYYPMMLVHSPYEPTPETASYAAFDRKKGKGGSHFADMVAHMDTLVGQVVAKLEEAGVRDHTLVFFLGDNGTGKGTPSRFMGRDVVGGKGTTTTWGTHVPLIANWPGKIPSGKIAADLIDATDFLPTICEAASVSIPVDLKIDGRSFMPQLRGEKGQPREWLYAWYNPSGGPKARAEFAHDALYKLYADGRFFDVKADELEKKPLATDTLNAEAKTEKEKLQGVLDQFRGARPEGIAKQGQAFGGEGDAGKAKPKKNKKK